jgi:hypothetical protein
LNNESKLISAQRKQNLASNDRQCLDRIQSRIKRVLATSVTCYKTTIFLRTIVSKS